MSDETTLLPCPVCGGEIPAPTRRYMSVLICPTCNAYGPGNSDMTNDELIAAWNTRAYLNQDGLPNGLTISDDGNLLNWRGENYVRQGSDTLTAEQVCEAIEEAKAELLESCEYVGDMGQRKSDVLKAFDKMEQAIADELNAELGSGTCEMVLMWSDYEDGECYKCSKCGDFAFTCGGEPRFCPECGAKVVGK